MRYAIIVDGVVQNVTRADSALESNWVESDVALIGDSYNGKKFKAQKKAAEKARPVRLDDELTDAEKRALIELVRSV